MAITKNHIFHRVAGREIDLDNRQAVETLECGHENILYRRADGNRVAWCNQQGVPTNLSANSRECPTCTVDEVEKNKGWKP